MGRSVAPADEGWEVESREEATGAGKSRRLDMYDEKRERDVVEEDGRWQFGLLYMYVGCHSCGRLLTISILDLASECKVNGTFLLTIHA